MTRLGKATGQLSGVTSMVQNGRYCIDVLDQIQAVAVLPLRITFDWRESGDCTSRVVFPELGITRALPADAKLRHRSAPR